jgi:hypothetical protein
MQTITEAYWLLPRYSDLSDAVPNAREWRIEDYVHAKPKIIHFSRSLQSNEVFMCHS